MFGDGDFDSILNKTEKNVKDYLFFYDKSKKKHYFFLQNNANYFFS